MPGGADISPGLVRCLALAASRLRAAVEAALAADAPHGSLHRHLASLWQRLLPAAPLGGFADIYAQTLMCSLVAERLTGCALPLALPDEEAPTSALLVHPELAPLLAEASQMLSSHGTPGAPHDPRILTHFYETFLATYDPRQRGGRGVYATPEAVVSYMVRSVDGLLHTHLGFAAGFADERVAILDPATGTAPFLHDIVDQVAATLARQGDLPHASRCVASTLPRRMVGFELLLAPWAIARLALGLHLAQSGMAAAPGERPAIHLANALDELPRCYEQFFPTAPPCLVVLGNPPYANFGRRNKNAQIGRLLDDYKQGLGEKKLNLDDDYIKFMRLGQWCVERAGAGILAFITSNTYLDGITHRRMRQSLLETFTDIYLLDLHGSSKRGEQPPAGLKDENVFRIQQGVAIAFFVKAGGKSGPARVHHADLWGTRAARFAALAATDAATTPWRTIHPRAGFFFFVPEQSADNTSSPESTRYAAYHPLPAMFLAQQGAIKTDRDRLFFDVHRPTLEARMRAFYSEEGLSPAFRAAFRVENSSSYPVLTRRETTTFDTAHLQPCLYRPFDTRWLYYAPGLTSRPAREVMRHMLAGANVALLLCRQQATPGFAHVFCAETLVESHAVSIKTREGAFVFPLYRYTDEGERQPNFSPALLASIQHSLGLAFVPAGTGDLHRTMGAEDIFHYLYALLHSPTYRQRHAARLKVDFPRLPLPRERATFAALAARGAALLDLHLLRLPGRQQREQVGGAGGAAPLCTPASQGVRPGGRGTSHVEQVVYLPPDGEQPGRVMLNPACWVEGIAPAVWEMQIGSYRPLAKWLHNRMGHTLTIEEMLHAARVVVALRETLRLMHEIDPWVGPLL